jgi:A/G-specific adenine glycosylase
VWLSEVMLQQTRVAVVEGYFRRFVARFPDVEALAAASEDDVLSLWSGLGYYSRGRNLHRAAQAVVAGGGFPSTSAGLATLPGVGPYTAAAIASLAFGERVAVVDGNVARVLARLANDATPIDSAAGRAAMSLRAGALTAASIACDPAKVSEGLMELGALVCTPRSPSCDRCPWATSCAALAAGAVESLPVKLPKRARKLLRVACVVIVDDRCRVWLEKRASRGLFGGLYEPPSRQIVEDGVASRLWRAILEERGLPLPKRWPTAVVVERTLTHRDLRFDVLRVDVGPCPGQFIDDVTTIGLSTAARAVLVSVGAVAAAT